MKHKKKSAIEIIIIFTMIILSNYSCSNKSNKSDNSKDKISNVLSIDDVIENPENYKDLIWVSGKVANVDSLHSTFNLGCEDACVYMPVECKGKLPSNSNEIIVYGQIVKNTDNKFIFKAKEYKAK